MAKLVAPDKQLVAVDVKDRFGNKKGEVKVKKDGTFTVEDKSLASKMRSEGFINANLMGATTSATGYPCKACGFGSWFKKCSRCGEENG